jgi:peptide/nickel transport system permease protein
VIAFLARRLAYGAGVLTGVAFLIYGVERALRPENYPSETYLPSVWHDVERALLHLDFGEACGWPGCPRIYDMWIRGVAADLWMLAGGMLFGVLGGVGIAVWCARRPRALLSRSVQAVAMLAYCTPVFVVGLGLVLLFNSDIGIWPVPYFFDALPRAYVSPLDNPWSWFRAFVVPCLVVAAPLAGACVRMTTQMTLEELGRDHVRTARAKGLSAGRVIRRHAAPGAYLSVTSLVWASIPAFVTNLVLVEWVFNVPGFFVNTKRAINQDPFFPGLDVPMLQALALWAAVLICVMSILADVALAAIDPRVRLDARGSRA